MSEEFTIEKFIENRWTEARTELESIAPKFVQAFQTWDSLKKLGIVLPEEFPDPEERLPDPWHEILESSMDVIQAIERVEITVELLEGNTELRLARFYHGVWLQNGYAVCQKVQALIAHSCKLHSIDLETKRSIYSTLKSNVLYKIDQRRTALVHGANRPTGKKSITATAMTDEGYWEGAVYFGHQTIRAALAGSNESGRFQSQDYHALVLQEAKGTLRVLGAVLEQVEHEFSHEHL